MAAKACKTAPSLPESEDGMLFAFGEPMNAPELLPSSDHVQPPHAPGPAPAGRWPASLELGFESVEGRTVMARVRHYGPLRVQKALYPEGGAICHTILLHPPAGIVGGDTLNFDIAMSERAHVLMTTPGASKWYRSDGRMAHVTQRLSVASEAVCEWLPQENIVFDGAQGKLDTCFSLSGDATLIAADMLCLGRIGSGERFRHGRLTLATRISVDGRPIWLERGHLDGGGALLDSPVGLAGHPVSATMLVRGAGVDAALRDACREITSEAGEQGVTLLPEGLLVARWLGPASEPGRLWMKRVWACVRPVLAGRTGQEPRIWRT